MNEIKKAIRELGRIKSQATGFFNCVFPKLLGVCQRRLVRSFLGVFLEWKDRNQHEFHLYYFDKKKDHYIKIMDF